MVIQQFNSRLVTRVQIYCRCTLFSIPFTGLSVWNNTVHRFFRYVGNLLFVLNEICISLSFSRCFPCLDTGKTNFDSSSWNDLTFRIFICQHASWRIACELRIHARPSPSWTQSVFLQSGRQERQNKNIHELMSHNQAAGLPYWSLAATELKILKGWFYTSQPVWTKVHN